MGYVKNNKLILKDVMKLALPAIGEMSLYMIVWTVDSIMIGKYGGKDALSAVGMSSQFLYTFVDILIAIGLSVALTSIIARAYGSKNYQKGDEYATHGIILTSVIAITLTLVFYLFCQDILKFCGAKGNVLNLGIKYMRIASIAIFFNMFLTSLNGILRGIGNTFIPFIASGILVLVNLLLDWLLIFGIGGCPELGVEGAAIATMIANIIALSYIVIYFKVKSRIKPRIRYVKNVTFKKISDLLKLAIPSGMQEGAFSICRLINSMMILTLGEVAFAANHITVSIESISFMPGWGVAVAATSLIGQRIGEKDYEGAREYGRMCLILGVLIMGLCGILFLVFSEVIANVFIQENQVDVLKSAKLCIMIASIEQIPTAISMIAGGALKGAGDTKTPFLVSLFSNWVIRMPLMILAVMVFKLDITVIWWITSIQWTIDAILMLRYYKLKFVPLKINKRKVQ
ncbi:MATE family efflux transporter [Oceanirhabdus seepicola]|uniref:Probable multidrug resistance protein NorM n=1 Tax=Oceanirhabdus seepicola TaxID=2828781 RepID=A0A9J6P9Y4_9CLOT|nr:MATE family efflux transporter [Oceanirhabdus seepicola]MCM1992852.1 MATE family efflux transporter [Oceanirhabdus seepicola]